jgi:hypothetical protein
MPSPNPTLKSTAEPRPQKPNDVKSLIYRGLQMIGYHSRVSSPRVTRNSS